MRLLFVGDVVGRAGRKVVLDNLADIKSRLKADFVVVNGENAAGGFGITEEIFQNLCDAGADVVTTGNHVWDQRDALVFIERHPALLRPVNFPPGTPGRGANLFETSAGKRVLVVNAMGRVFMDPMDDPFAAIDRELEACPLGGGCDAVLFDFHAETTSEKMAMGHYVDGRVSLIVGTHTHVPTGDHQILPGGSAYLTDAGMSGDYNSVIGMKPAEPLERFTRKISTGRFEPADGEATLCGVVADLDPQTGLAVKIEVIRYGGRLAPVWPQ